MACAAPRPPAPTRCRPTHPIVQSHQGLAKLFDPLVAWMAPRYQAVVAKELRKYGLRYEDLYDPQHDLVRAGLGGCLAEEGATLLVACRPAGGQCWLLPLLMLLRIAGPFLPASSTCTPPTHPPAHPRQDVDEALKRLPQEALDARNQRLKRATDLNMKARGGWRRLGWRRSSRGRRVKPWQGPASNWLAAGTQARSPVRMSQPLPFPSPPPVQHSELPKDMQDLQTPYAFYLKDTLDVSGRAGQRGEPACAQHGSSAAAAAGRSSDLHRQRDARATRLPTTAALPGHCPVARHRLTLAHFLTPLLRAQLVKLEADERLALGAGKPYERHFP